MNRLLDNRSHINARLQPRRHQMLAPAAVGCKPRLCRPFVPRPRARRGTSKPRKRAQRLVNRPAVWKQLSNVRLEKHHIRALRISRGRYTPHRVGKVWTLGASCRHRRPISYPLVVFIFPRICHINVRHQPQRGRGSRRAVGCMPCWASIRSLRVSEPAVNSIHCMNPSM